MSLAKKLEEKGFIFKVEKKDYENIKLEENEYLLKISGSTGFMSPLTQKKEIPKSFLSWRESEDIYIIKEEFRPNWEMHSVHSGMSTSWVVCKHPYGFYVEINPKAFNNLINKIEIIKGVIKTPLYFVPNIKNAELKVN
jgi:hypothetical protein